MPASITTELAVGWLKPDKRTVSGFVEGSYLIMFQAASHLLHRVTDRRCPSCGCVEVRRSARKNSFEAALLPFLLTRPFRCENCGNRFYGLAFRRRAPAPDNAKPMSDLPQDYPVLVYGRGEGEEPFQEETNVRALNLRGGLITLATRVEPGQHLVLINLATEEDQPCRVAFVGEQPAAHVRRVERFLPHRTQGVVNLAFERRHVEVEILSARDWWTRDPDEVVRTIMQRYATAV